MGGRLADRIWTRPAAAPPGPTQKGIVRMIRWPSRLSVKRLTLSLGVGVAGLVLLAGALAQPVPLPPRVKQPMKQPVKPKPPAPPMVAPGPVNEVIQAFPSNDVMETAW